VQNRFLLPFCPSILRLVGTMRKHSYAIISAFCVLWLNPATPRSFADGTTNGAEHSEKRTSVAVIAQAAQLSGTDRPCAAADHRRLDFMIGSWNTSDGPANNAPRAEGYSTVEAMLDGCIVHEHRHVTRQGKKLFDGDAYWGYDVTTKRWLLFYLDDASHAQVYEGREDSGHLAFYRERPDPDGKMIVIRITYAPVGNGYTQAVERSADHGATWTSGGITTYLPKS
jgi:hypothetical protein